MQGEGHALGALIQSVLAEQQRVAVVLAGLQRDVADNTIDTAKLVAVLTNGNGAPPITVRLDRVERQLMGLETREAEGRRGRWDLTKTLLSALLAVASGLLLAILLK